MGQLASGKRHKTAAVAAALGQMDSEDPARWRAAGMGGTRQIQDHSQRLPERRLKFAPEFWNHGYATEAVWIVASYTLRNLREPYLFAYARPENGASLAVLKKVGFQETKRRIRDDSKRECLVFRISRSQFLSGLASIK